MKSFISARKSAKMMIHVCVAPTDSEGVSGYQVSKSPVRNCLNVKVLLTGCTQNVQTTAPELKQSEFSVVVRWGQI